MHPLSVLQQIIIQICINLLKCGFPSGFMSRNLQTNTGPPAPSVSDVLVSDAATAASIHIKVNHLSSNAATAHMLSKSSYHILQYGDNTHATAARWQPHTPLYNTVLQRGFLAYSLFYC